MIKEMNRLQQKERELLLKAPALVAILIAGSEDIIDRKEIEMAEKIVNYRRISGDIRLFTYYDNVHLNFHDNLVALENQYSANAAIRNLQISEEIRQLNNVLPKLGKEIAVAVYDNLKIFARHVAASSGGFLGFLSISVEEKEWIELRMLKDPREYMEDEHIEKGKLLINLEFLNNTTSEVHP